MKVKSESEVAQLCPTLSDPLDCSLPGSFVHGIFQTRVLEWVAIDLLYVKIIPIDLINYLYHFHILVSLSFTSSVEYINL